MKKLYSIILFICLIFNNFIINTFAKDLKNELNYIALGDSIALGYMPEEYKLQDGCYATLLKNYLEKNDKKVILKNNAISGQTSKKMLKQLNKLDISSADIITISIGSNDLLKPFTKIIFESLNCSDKNNFEKTLKELVLSARNYNILSVIKVYSIINNILNNNETFDNYMSNFEKNFIEMSKIIKEKNPNAQVIVTNFYNPYAFIENFGFKNFGIFTNEIIKKMNIIIEKIAIENNFEVIDINFIGNNIDYLNISLDGNNIMVDPHPSQLGHNKIYEQIVKYIEKNEDFIKIVEK